LPQLDETKRSRVLIAAKARFERFGFKKTAVDEIAQDVGISKRTLYEIFENKERILAEVVKSEATSFSTYCVDRLGQISDPVSRLQTLAELTREYFESNPFLGRVLSDDEGFYAPFLGGEIEFVELGIIRMIASILRRGMREGAFRPMDEVATARCIFVLFRHFVYASRSEAERADREWIRFTLQSLVNKR